MEPQDIFAIIIMLLVGALFITIILAAAGDEIAELWRRFWHWVDVVKDWFIDHAYNIRVKIHKAMYGKVIESVIAEPTQKKTSDGKLLEFIDVKMKNGDVKTLYKDTEFTYTWYYADSHEQASNDTNNIIKRLLNEYRIDNAETVDD